MGFQLTYQLQEPNQMRSTPYILIVLSPFSNQNKILDQLSSHNVIRIGANIDLKQ